MKVKEKTDKAGIASGRIFLEGGGKRKIGKKIASYVLTVLMIINTAFIDGIFIVKPIEAIAANDSSIDLESDLLMYYDFNDSLNNKVYNTTALNGSDKLSYIEGMSGKALYFSSADAAIKSYEGIPEDTTEYTLSYWVKQDDASKANSAAFIDTNCQYLLFGSNGSNLWPMVRISTNNAEHSWDNEQNRLDRFATGKSMAPTTDWSYFTATVSSDGTLKMYVNGQLVSDLHENGATDAGYMLKKDGSSFFSNQLQGWNQLSLGGGDWWNAAAGNGFIGALDEVTFYTRALSSNEVAALYANKGIPSNSGEFEDSDKVVPQHVSVHDPSIVKDEKTGMYYVFGSHMAWAKSKDLIHWETFTNNINTDFKNLFKKGEAWASHGSSSYDLSGNLWAPDVIWNEEMGKWCMYMSVNGDKWYTSIALLTADSLEGDWTYVDTIVYSGFTNSTEAAETDYAKVIGNNTVDPRYLENRNGSRTYGMNAIDPCVLYDDAGNLWMTYGSWFGGIYMLKLDSKTGLRDYTETYQTVANTSDAYQGIKIAGGQHVSGEASYIEKIGDYWYLFMSNGGLTATGGYNMRIFRSSDIKGPYVDYSGDDARYTSAVNNINGTVGNRPMSGYQWSYMSVGQVAQGHNSAFLDSDGRSYLVYHTRFNDGTEGHQVRVHQMFLNEEGWLVTAPFEYTGETLTNQVTAEDVTGMYEVLFHKLNINYGSLEVVKGENITFNTDGTITGDRTGTWAFSQKGKPYVTLKIGNTTYKGVFVKQQMEESTDTTWTFTVLGDDEISVWGYKYVGDGTELAEKAAANLSMPEGTFINLTLPSKGINASTITWKSSNEAVLASDGTVTEPDTDTEVTLTGTFTVNGASVNRDYKIMVYSPQTDTENKILKKYFTGQEVDLTSAVKGTYQYANPFYDGTTKGLQMYNGASIKFDVNPTAGADQWLTDIIGFNTGNTGGLYFEGNSYLGFNHGAGKIFDANVVNGSSWAWGTNFITTSASVEIKILPTGFEVYVNDVLAYNQADIGGKVPGSTDMASWASILDFLQNAATYLNFGWGSWWEGGYKGTISNVELSVLPIEVTDTTGYLYYENFNKLAGKTGNDTGWISPNASDKLSIIAASDAHGYYLSYANPATSGNRVAYTVFPKEANVSKDFMVEADIMLNSGGDNATVFAITDALHTNTKNNDITEGYFLKLTVAKGSTTCTVAGTDYSFTLPKNTWVHVSVSVDENGNIVAKVGDKELTGTSTATAALGGMFLLNARSGSYSAVDNIAVHAHDWGEGTVTKKPSCTETGIKTYTCSVCQETKTEELEVTEHTWDDGKETKAPSCTETGVKTYTCTACKETKTEEIKATGHTESEPVEENRVEATCIKEGSYDLVVRCSVCDEILSTEKKTIPLAEHTWDEGEIKVEPTCTETGTKICTCTVCGETKEEIVDALGHIANDGGTIVKEPTCTEDGILDFTCSRCHQGVTQPIEALGHDWTEWNIEKEPTCTEDGKRSHSCKRTACGEVEEQILPALDHIWSEWSITSPATCTEDGEKTRTCTRTGCGEIEKESIEALGHTAGEAVKENEIKATCETEGSYDEVVYCSVCKEELERVHKTVSALGHTAGETVKENEVEATCETEGSYDEVIYCSVCKKEMSRVHKTVSALGHTAGEAVKENEVEAACETEGSYDEVVYCSVCKKEMSRNGKTVPALGHDWTQEGAITKEPTCTEKGEKTYTCSRCDSIRTEEIPATGHSYKEPVFIWKSDDSVTAEFICTLCSETNVVNAEVKITTKNGIATHVASVTFDGKIYTITKQIILLEEETDKRIVVSDTWEEIPESLVEAKLDTKEKIVEKLSKVVIENGHSSKNSAFYDVVLQTLESDGTTWKTVTAENFPKEGVTLTIPYPEGTNRFDFDFMVTHMFTVSMNGYHPGDVEILNAEKTENGLKVTVSSLSPIGVSWVALDEEKEPPTKQEETTTSESTETQKPSNSVTTPPKTGDSPLLGWLLICGMVSCGFAVAITNFGRNKKAGK